jgi:hypothetical protein
MVCRQSLPWDYFRIAVIQALDRQALPIACKARRFWVGRLLRFLHRAVEREFSDERWGLIEIAGRGHSE